MHDGQNNEVPLDVYLIKRLKDQNISLTGIKKYIHKLYKIKRAHKYLMEKKISTGMDI